ncbi:hypothetical protein BJV77DRAFT_756136 [Russula vinacea]|nr:hypothetical protein BJV77DRAFT_756136 [Russula vinacea]
MIIVGLVLLLRGGVRLIEPLIARADPGIRVGRSGTPDYGVKPYACRRNAEISYFRKGDIYRRRDRKPRAVRSNKEVRPTGLLTGAGGAGRGTGSDTRARMRASRREMVSDGNGCVTDVGLLWLPLLSRGAGVGVDGRLHEFCVVGVRGGGGGMGVDGGEVMEGQERRTTGVWRVGGMACDRERQRVFVTETKGGFHIGVCRLDLWMDGGLEG